MSGRETVTDLGRMLGLLVLSSWHGIWLSGAYTAALPRTIAAIISLLLGTSFWRKWERQAPLSASRSVETFRGVAIIGFALAALNLYFVHAYIPNLVLSAAAFTMIIVGLLAQGEFRGHGVIEVVILLL